MTQHWRATAFIQALNACLPQGAGPSNFWFSGGGGPSSCGGGPFSAPNFWFSGEGSFLEFSLPKRVLPPFDNDIHAEGRRVWLKIAHPELRPW